MTASTNQSGVVFTATGATRTLSNGNVIYYRIINGIYYHATTPAAVLQVLERVRADRMRVRIHYGDTAAGRDWLEEHDVEGYIGNSLGPLKVPLLIHNRRCLGGFALLDHCIVKIKSTRNNILYQHPNYHAGTFAIRAVGPDETCGNTNLYERGYTHAVDVNGQNHGNFRSQRAAERFVQKMTG